MPPSNRPTPEATVEPRKRPRQERSQELVERILEAASQLAAEEGLDGISTPKIAARAGLSVGSLYQYFPNKDAIVVELARRWLARFRPLLEQARQAPRPRSWEEFVPLWCEFLRAAGRLYRETSAMLPILECMHASKELRRIERDHDDAVVEGFGRWFRDLNPALSRATGERLGRIVLETAHPCMTLAAQHGAAQGRRIQEDLETMLLALLREHLDLA